MGGHHIVTATRRGSNTQSTGDTHKNDVVIEVDISEYMRVCGCDVAQEELDVIEWIESIDTDDEYAMSEVAQ